MEQQQKTATQNNNNKVVIKNIEFIGKVVEVHSGDSLTIQSVKFGTVGRFSLTNLKAPVILRNTAKPYAYESKEFLRKMVIGKQVKVQMEYEKFYKVTREIYDEEKDDLVEVTENKNTIFAMVEFEGKQLAVEVVSKGYASVQKPFQEIEQSKIYEDLVTAQEEAKKRKLGIHKAGEYKQRFIRDLSQKGNIKQARNTFEHLKDQKISGVVEYVFNGSTFKIRCNDQNCYIMMVLLGVRCLPQDDNFPGYNKWRQKATDFTKNQVQQRDVEIYIKKIDKKGVFQGVLVLNKKEDYAETLLKEGLAVCYGNADNQSKLDQLEGTARNQKVGLWGEQNLDLAGVKGDFGKKEIIGMNEKRTCIVGEVLDCNEFYLQNPNGTTLDKITKELENFDPKHREKLQLPIKPNTPCVAIFDADGNFYRAHVVKEIPNKLNKFQVHFIDFGNYGQVDYEDMRKMPTSYLQIPPQADRCALAYVQGPTKKEPLYEESIDAIMDYIWDKQITAQFVYKFGNTNFVVLSDKKQNINEQLLKEGLVRIDAGVDLPSQYNNWLDIQNQAQENQTGIWKYVDEE
ncbi:hypothetical protein PPERSA_01410 [Pseudocohnilembus persalinus]|uniref:TNase-like domain-containing protein n=1 Tax=Pseudocohnilembus persalinus TaxID=266149 RepID=A0A0V0QGU4_PSEPJ|nr:hypothetical protein PPERSA_01410 [Pseudocohnilembus persalinus]|eukprot:KRX01507.1 hypothetical protein PPERSA_01410 [Pseudocohnilembus persalinus]